MKKIVKLYEKQVLEDPKFNEKDIDEYLQSTLSTYDNHAHVEPIEEQIRSWLTLLKFPLSLFEYEAFKKEDMELLNNALYQSASIIQVQQIWGGGTDHSKFFLRIIPNLLITNMCDSIPLFVPEHLGMSSNGHIVGITTTNLFMALWYSRKDFEEVARLNAKKCLSHKQNIEHRAIIEYLLATT